MRTVSAGTRVSEYILEKPLGAGAFAEVWLGHHHIWTDRQVAVKIARDEAYVRYLKREGILLHKLNHPRIVSTLGLDPEYDPPYIIAEYMDGGSLRDLLGAEGRLGPARTLEIVEAALEALAFAHDNDVIHRDLKPENILLRAGEVKLSDFGLGQVTSELTLSSVFKSEGGQAGTPLYFSPEQRASEPLDGRSDLYAVGLILFECLTGSLPAGLEMPSEHIPGLPEGFDAIFQKLYARKDKRYASAHAALADVRRLWGVLGRPSAAAEGGPGAPSRGGEAAVSGDAVSGEGFRPASLFDRLVAHGFDILLLLIVFYVVARRGGAPFLYYAAAHFLYSVIMVAGWGGTVGKLLVGVRVRSADGRAVDFFQAFWRYVVAVVSLGLGLLMIPFDREGRAAHDYAANTRVVWR